MRLLKKFILTVIQICLYPLFLIIRIVLVRGKLQRKTDLSLQQQNISYVIYANHQSILDPVVILSSLPFSLFIRIVPIRSFVKNVCFQSIVSNIFFRLCGCFPAYETKRSTYGLNKARIVLQSQQSVLIFPQGKRTRENIARRGVSVLAGESSVYLLPIYVNWRNRLSCDVKIGSPFKVHRFTNPLHLMEQVYRLDAHLADNPPDLAINCSYT